MHRATSRICWQLVRDCLIGACISLLCFSHSLAGVEVCEHPPDQSLLSVAYYDHKKSALADNVGQTNRENHDIDLLFNLNEEWVFGVKYRYDILAADAIELQTNGHLHSLVFPLYRQIQSADRSFRISIAPALSASSNIITDPSEYSSDAFQLLAALVWTRKLSDRTTLRYGVCADHRFGTYQLYPSVSIVWHPHVDWTIELGFPTTRLTYQVSTNVSSSLRIAPDGNEWHVENENMSFRSQLVNEASLVEWTLDWQARKNLTLTASVGRQFDNQYEVTWPENNRMNFSSDSATRIGAAIAWRF